MQLTTNLPVDIIEPSVAFFAKIGFSIAMRLPHSGPMTFAILANGAQHLMFQTRKCLLDDHAAFHGDSVNAQVMRMLQLKM
ncbi:MAG: hypothetical protein JKY57_05115 [Kordiimonadaceae bacterium]|nr:hypothetical protein [Kordiimonadaceae bacterium]